MQREVLLRKLEEKEVFITPGALELMQGLKDETIGEILVQETPILTEEDVLNIKESIERKFKMLEKEQFNTAIDGKADSSFSNFDLNSQKRTFSLDNEKLRSVERIQIIRSPFFKPLSKEYSSELEIMGTDVEGCAGEVDNFVEYFRDRLENVRRMLKTRAGGAGTTTIESLKRFVSGRSARIIGIVNERRPTKKGNILIELEDETGAINAVVTKETPAFLTAQNLLLDEIVALDGKIAQNHLFICDNVIYPDIPIREIKKTEEDVVIAFLSDVHVGSKLFMRRNFEKMIEWINGSNGAKEKEMEMAGKIKYLVIAGDIVDGIGIYPSQENELEEKDIYKQYEMFERYIEQVPDYIEVIVAPGNHDAVRRAEPQPSLPKEFFKSSSMKLIPNPCYLKMHNLLSLMYHGTSMDSLISALSSLSYEYPEKAMIEILKRRLLSPIYGDNPIVPTKKDHLTITEIPDILHMGHIHKNGYSIYSGTVVINSGTWQDRTDYQIKQGHVPTPCHLPLYETKYGRISVVDFK